VWPKKGKFRAKTGVGHWVGHMDNESGVGRVVRTKRQLFGKTNKNTNYLSAAVPVVNVVCAQTHQLKMIIPLVSFAVI
jgi:hypothetical protein